MGKWCDRFRDNLVDDINDLSDYVVDEHEVSEDNRHIFDSHRKAAFDFGRCVLLPNKGLHQSGYTIRDGSEYEYGCWIYTHGNGFSYCKPYTDNVYNSVNHANRGQPTNVVAYAHTHPVKNMLKSRKEFSGADCCFSITQDLPLYLCYLDGGDVKVEEVEEVKMHVKRCQKTTNSQKLSNAEKYNKQSQAYSMFATDKESLQGSSDEE